MSAPPRTDAPARPGRAPGRGKAPARSAAGLGRAVHEDAALRIAVLEGDPRRLVVVFTGLGQGMGPVRLAEFEASSSGEGRNTVIFVADKRSTWYEAPGLADRVRSELARLIAAMAPERTLFVGNSMGGYGAILFSAALAPQTVLAFGPQWSLRPGAVPGETRWRRAAERVGEIRTASLADSFAPSTDYILLHGLAGADRAQAAMFPEGQRIRHYLVPGRDHDTGQALKQAGLLPGLVRAALAGRMARVDRLIRRAGGLPRAEAAPPAPPRRLTLARAAHGAMMLGGAAQVAGGLAASAHAIAAGGAGLFSAGALMLIGDLRAAREAEP